MSDTLGMVHPGAKFFPISGHAELKKISAFKMQGSDGHRITIIDVSFKRGENVSGHMSYQL